MKQDGPLKAKAVSFKLRNVINSMIEASIAAKAKIVAQQPVSEGSGLTASSCLVQSSTANRV